MKENKVNAHAPIAQLIEQLIALEYAIRQSTAVREDQEDDADASHLEAAKNYGINVTDEMTGSVTGVVTSSISKGDLLNAVQTRLRKLQTQTRDAANHAPDDT